MEQKLEDVIIQLKNAHKSRTTGSIYDGVYVKEILYEFQEEEIFQGVKIMLPVVFEDMPNEVAKIKYLSAYRPQIIKTNEDGSINFCFSLLEQGINEQGVREFANSYKEALKKMHLADSFYVEKEEQWKLKNFIWCAYRNYSMNGAVFNHVFFTTVKEHLLIGMFNCADKERELWKHVMKDIMLTLREEVIDKK